MTKIVLTTSWDDGHALDSKLVDVLGCLGVKGTFYIPRSFEGNPMISTAGMRSLIAAGHEVGGHTLGHLPLKGIPLESVQNEVSGCKLWLEDTIGSAVHAFCYPCGKHDRVSRSVVASSGFRYGRTTAAFYHTGEKAIDPYRMGTTLQVYPHPPHIHLSHAIKEMEFSSAMAYIRTGLAFSPAYIIRRLLGLCPGPSGFHLIHLWGHSWELESGSLWSMLVELVTVIKSMGEVRVETNTSAWDLMK